LIDQARIPRRGERIKIRRNTGCWRQIAPLPPPRIISDGRSCYAASNATIGADFWPPRDAA